MKSQLTPASSDMVRESNSDRLQKLALPNCHLVEAVLKEHYNVFNDDCRDRLKKLLELILTVNQSGKGKILNDKIRLKCINRIKKQIRSIEEAQKKDEISRNLNPAGDHDPSSKDLRVLFQKVKRCGREEAACGDHRTFRTDSRISNDPTSKDLLRSRSKDLLRFNDPRSKDLLSINDPRSKDLLRSNDLRSKDLLSINDPRSKDLLRSNDLRSKDLLRFNDPRSKDLLRFKDLGSKDLLGTNDPTSKEEVLRCNEVLRFNDLRCNEVLRFNEPRSNEVLRFNESRSLRTPNSLDYQSNNLRSAECRKAKGLLDLKVRRKSKSRRSEDKSKDCKFEDKFKDCTFEDKSIDYKAVDKSKDCKSEDKSKDSKFEDKFKDYKFEDKFKDCKSEDKSVDCKSKVVRFEDKSIGSQGKRQSKFSESKSKTRKQSETLDCAISGNVRDKSILDYNFVNSSDCLQPRQRLGNFDYELECQKMLKVCVEEILGKRKSGQARLKTECIARFIKERQSRQLDVPALAVKYYVVLLNDIQQNCKNYDNFTKELIKPSASTLQPYLEAAHECWSEYLSYVQHTLDYLQPYIADLVRKCHRYKPGDPRLKPYETSLPKVLVNSLKNIKPWRRALTDTVECCRDLVNDSRPRRRSVAVNVHHLYVRYHRKIRSLAKEE